MATRRFRIKAVANVSVSRGRFGEKPRENEKLDEKTSSNSSASSDSQECSPSETKQAESVSDFTIVGKLSGDSSSKDTLENTSVHHLVQNSENVREPSCLEINDSDDRSTPADTSVVCCNSVQHFGNNVVQCSGNCVRKEVPLCNRTDEDITGSNYQHCFKPEEMAETERSGHSCVTTSKETDAAENVPSAVLRLPRKRMKPTVSLSLVNRKAKENPTQQCNSLNETLENAVGYPVTQNSGNVSEPTTLEANDCDRSNPVDAGSVVTCNMTQDRGYADIQQSDDGGKDVSLCNRANEAITASPCEVSSKTEESIDFVRLEESCTTSSQKIDTTVTKIPAPPVRLPRKRVKPAVSLFSVNKRVKETPTVQNNPMCHSVQASAIVSEPSTCVEESSSCCSTPVEASVVNCVFTQDSGNAEIQQSDNCDSEDVSLCNRTNEDITASTGDQFSKTEESVDSVRSEELCGTSAQKIDTTETKIQAASIRLPRKRVKPTVCLSLVNKKVMENLTIGNNPVCHSVLSSANISEPTCFEENGSGRTTTENGTSIVTCNLAQDSSYADFLQSENCDNKDVSLCNGTNEDIAASTGEHCSKTEESIDTVRSEESCAASAHKIDTTETKIPVASIRLPRKRVKPTVCISLENKKVTENLTVENSPLCHSVQRSLNISKTTCLEENCSGRSTPEVGTSIVTSNLTQDSGYAHILQSGNSDNKDESLCNRTNKDIIAPTGEHCSETEKIIDSVRSEESSATSTEKIDTTETKIPAAHIRLPRKRVKPAVSLSLVNKKVKENLTIEDNPVCHSAQNSENVSEPTCLEENGSDRYTPVDALSVGTGTCNLTQDSGFADIQPSDNCDSKDVSICSRKNEDITSSTDEHCSKTEESIDAVRSEDSCVTSGQKIDITETKILAAHIRLPRKRVKPAVSLSLVNKKVKETLTIKDNPVSHSDQNSENVSEPTCLEENGSDCCTPVDAASVVTCNLTQDSGYTDIQQSDECANKDVSLCNRTNEYITASTNKNCSKTEESIDSVRSEDSCAISAEIIDTTEIKISSAPLKLPRKRMKPTVSLSSVNKKVQENPIVELPQLCNASRIDDNSVVQVPEKLQTSASSSDPYEEVEAGCYVRTIQAVDYETPNFNELRGAQKKNDSEIVPQTSVETHILQTTVCEPERKIEIPPDVSVGTPVGELGISTVTVSPPTCESNVKSDSPVVEKDKMTSLPVKCSVNQLVKDCSQLNSFRSRFVRPKPLLESAARRNRTGSIGSASESDSEKKSLSSATTVSPPWKPKLKSSRTRLTTVNAMETDRVANVSNASTDESEDERSIISKAATISPPKKITRLDSYGGSDTSYSEFSQEVSDDNSSPVKKPTKPEWITKRKEYLRRIIEIKKEISHKVSDGRVNKSRLTMFDLIYYNPVTNPMKSVQEPDGKKSGPAPTTAIENENRLAEESVDEPEALEDEEQSSTVPVPQVKVGPNGEIILDERSLVIETTDAKKNWNDLQNSEVIMDYGNGTTTYNAYSKKRRTRTKGWNTEETLRFYRALHTVGTDFLVMQSLFPKFTRKELKDRYKKEERINRTLVEKALRNPLTFDLTELQKEFELERLEEEKRLAQPKMTQKPKRKGGFSRSCSLYATLDSTDKGDREKPVKRKCVKLKALEETRSKKKRKPDDTRTPESAADRKEIHNKKNKKTDDTRTPSESAADRKETHNKKKRKTGDKRTTECTPDSEETQSKKKRKADGARALSERLPDGDASNALNGHGDTVSSVPEEVSQVKPTRSGRIPRPRIFEDFMTDVEEIYEETEITEICERVTVEDICGSEPLGDESVDQENVVVDEDTMATYESENEEQNFVIAEDALTVQQSQVNLGSVYSNVKPGTLIVLATESPDNPGHQIFRVFMVSNNSETLPVSVANNQASPTGTTNSVEMNTLTEPVVAESSTNDCNSLQMSAESSS